MRMRIAALLLCTVLMLGFTAVAETIYAGSYSVVIPNGFIEDDDYTDEDTVGVWYNDELYVRVFDLGETATAEEMEEQLLQDDEQSFSDHGITEINGYRCTYMVEQDTDDGMYLVMYAVPDDDTVILFSFAFEDSAVNNTVLEIMNTLGK